MKNIKYMTLIDFECMIMDLAENLGVKNKDDLEYLSATLHEHLETAMEDYAMDGEIEDYEPQY